MLKVNIRTECALPANLIADSEGKVSEYREFCSDGKTLKKLNIDQFSSQPFMRNACGFVMNDIMAFESSQNESVARAILERCKIYKDGTPDVSETPIDVGFDEIMPRNYQSPAELVKYARRVGEARYNRELALQKAEQAKNDKISFEENKSE